MVAEVLASLQVTPGGVYVDCTTGEGGHAEAILRAATPPPRLVGFDLDSDALKTAADRLKDFEQHVELIHGNYADMAAAVNARGIERVDGVLMDEEILLLNEVAGSLRLDPLDFGILIEFVHSAHQASLLNNPEPLYEHSIDCAFQLLHQRKVRLFPHTLLCVSSPEYDRHLKERWSKYRLN